MEDLARHLFKYGVVSLPIVQLGTAAARQEALEKLDAVILTEMPEFNPAYIDTKHPEHDGGPVRLVMGGFAALGTASSFHNTFVRWMRMLVHTDGFELFRALVQLPEFVERYPHASTYKLEQLIDRLLIRAAGDTASAEAWHRDSSPEAKPLDLIFGGFLNFSQHAQHFSCQLKSHHSAEGSSVSRVGFNPINGKDLKASLALTITSTDQVPRHRRPWAFDHLF